MVVVAARWTCCGCILRIPSGGGGAAGGRRFQRLAGLEEEGVGLPYLLLVAPPFYVVDLFHWLGGTRAKSQADSGPLVSGAGCVIP